MRGNDVSGMDVGCSIWGEGLVVGWIGWVF